MPASNRSPIVQQLMARMLEQQPPQEISSYGQLAAHLGANLIRKHKLNKAEDQQKTQQQQIIEALMGGSQPPPQGGPVQDVQSHPAVISESGAMGGAPSPQQQQGDPRRALMLALQNPEALQSNPMLAQFIMQQLEPQKRDVRNVGNQLVDITDGSPEAIFTGEQQPSEFETKLKLAGIDTATPEGQQFVKEMLQKAGVQVNNYPAGEFGAVPGAHRRIKDPNSPTGTRVVPEVGAPPPPNPNKLPAETAAKVGMLDAAEKSLTEARAILLPKDGGYRKGLLTAMYSPIRTGAAAKFYNALRDAMSNRLRAESGASITDSDIDDALERFLPKPWDTKEEAEARFQRFTQFTTSYRSAVGAQPQQEASSGGMHFKDLPE